MLEKKPELCFTAVRNEFTTSPFIIHYGLTQAQQNILEKCLPKNTRLHDATDCATDIIALCPTICIVINPSVMPEKDRAMILEFYELISWEFSEVLIFTKKIDIPERSNIIYISDNDFTSEKLNTALTQVKHKLAQIEEMRSGYGHDE